MRSPYPHHPRRSLDRPTLRNPKITFSSPDNVGHFAELWVKWVKGLGFRVRLLGQVGTAFPGARGAQKRHEKVSSQDPNLAKECGKMLMKPLVF